MGVAFKEMVGELHMIEASMGACATQGCHAIFEKGFRGAQPRLKMRFTEQTGLIAVRL